MELYKSRVSEQNITNASQKSREQENGFIKSLLYGGECGLILTDTLHVL